MLKVIKSMHLNALDYREVPGRLLNLGLSKNCLIEIKKMKLTYWHSSCCIKTIRKIAKHKHK